MTGNKTRLMNLPDGRDYFGAGRHLLARCGLCRAELPTPGTYPAMVTGKIEQPLLDGSTGAKIADQVGETLKPVCWAHAS